MLKSKVYLIPSVLDEGSIQTIPRYVVDAIKDSQVIFAENERSARRFFKSIWKEMVIDSYEWFTIHNAEEAQVAVFKKKINEGKNIAIISEAGCPGVADPGQILVHAAHQMNVMVKPLVGPSSILLALMASGMNGQQFQFVGYLPIDSHQRLVRIKELEEESIRKKCTQIFIETPYRNNKLLEDLLQILQPNTDLCIATDITLPTEFIKTYRVADWKKLKVDLHNRPTIFIIHKS